MDYHAVHQGWITEIDPFDASATPKKRTAMGRFRHKNAAVTVAQDGRAVVYMGDDMRDAYVYEFVSRNDFLNETTRLPPWLRARFERSPEGLVVVIETELGQSALVVVLNYERGNRWLAALGAEQALGERTLETFADYLVKWRWTEVRPLRLALPV